GLAGQRNERVGRDVERQGKALTRCVDEPTLEILAFRESKGMDEDVESAVSGLPAVEDAPDIVVGLDVARLDEGRPDALGERANAFHDEALDRREPDRRALIVERLRDSP